MYVLTDPIYYPWPKHVLMEKEWSQNGNMSYYFNLIPHQFFWVNFFPLETEALKKTLLLKIHKGGFILRVWRICDVPFNIAISSQQQRT